MSIFEFNHALVRQPCAEVVNGLRRGQGEDPSFEGINDLHLQYIEALRSAGLSVAILPPLPEFPDSVFIEDPALVFADAAILLKPGASAREQEAAELLPILRARFSHVLALPEGTVDGGDVLVTPGRVLIGISQRTNEQGAKALAGVLAEIGYAAIIVRPPLSNLHLKSSAGLIDEETVVTTAALAASEIFADFRVVIVPEAEERAANVLRVNDSILVAADCPASLELLAHRDLTIVPLDVSEIQKIDGGLTCLSLRWLSSQPDLKTREPHPR